MAKIIKSGKKFSVVNSITKIPVKGGRNLTKSQAQKKKREVVKRNCGKNGKRCKN